MITGPQLRAAFVDDATMHYFRHKLPDLGHDELCARLEETLKFLFISSECTGAIPVAREIDEVWHLWILQTAEYAQLCGALPGGEFVHHSSNDYLRYFDDTVGRGNPLDEDVRMLATYVRNFGPLEVTRIKYWRLASDLAARGWSAHEINGWLDRGEAMASGAARDARTRRAHATPRRGNAGNPRETPRHSQW